MQEETGVPGENLRGRVWIGNQTHAQSRPGFEPWTAVVRGERYDRYTSPTSLFISIKSIIGICVEKYRKLH